MKGRIVVAMSGGVDSAVAACLLHKQGYEVIGITMCFNLPDLATKKPRCCGLQGIEDARRVAHKLGIRHYVLNMQKILEKKVIADFCQEYSGGRTPNPCVRCNQFVKFGALLEKAHAWGARYLATGHYARIARLQTKDYRPKTTDQEPQTYLLKKAKDLRKDQSYFLYRLSQKQLASILFPLANYTKEQVREIARDFGLPVAGKLESQEICFLPGMNYRGFLRQRGGEKIKPGIIVDRAGEVLGQHQGLPFYTIGQRQGLGIAMGYPLYVLQLDAGQNKIVVGSKKEAYQREFWVGKVNFIGERIKKKVALKVKIRYNHPEASAQVIPEGRRLKVNFQKPQFAVTPGQSAVFYKGKTVIGGGIIQ